MTGAHTNQMYISPDYLSASVIRVPEPLEYAVKAGLDDYSLAAQETMALDAGTPIFQDLVNQAVQRQIKHEEDQLRAWLRAIINDPAGRKIIEELL